MLNVRWAMLGDNTLYHHDPVPLPSERQPSSRPTHNFTHRRSQSPALSGGGAVGASLSGGSDY